MNAASQVNGLVNGWTPACLLRQGAHRAAVATAVARVCACLLALGAASASASEALIDKHDFLNAPASTDRQSSGERLQQIFWMCDFASGVGDLDAGQAAQCSSVAAHLQRVMFKGDAQAFVVWRRLNQAAAHAQLAAGRSELNCLQAVSQTESRSQP